MLKRLLDFLLRRPKYPNLHEELVELGFIEPKKPFKSAFPIKGPIPGVSEEMQEKAWKEYCKTKPKRPRLYKQAVVVTTGELPKGEDYAWPFPTTIVPPPKLKRKPALKKATTLKKKAVPAKKTTSKATKPKAKK